MMVPCDVSTHSPSNGPGKIHDFQALLHCAVSVHSCLSYHVLWTPVTTLHHLSSLKVRVWSLHFTLLSWVRNWSSPFTQSLSITGLWITLIFSHILFLASCVGTVRRTIPAMLSLNFPWVSTPHSLLSPNLNYFHSSWSLHRLKMPDLCSPRWWRKLTQHDGFFGGKGWMKENTALIL